MRILGIDPSFTSTGLAIVEDGVLIETLAIHEGGNVYKGIDLLNKAAFNTIKSIEKFIIDYHPECVVVEYPAQTKSGFYLMTLHGWIMAMLYEQGLTIYSVPPTACNSLIKNKENTKSYIVDYCKKHGWVPMKRINNDICTAVVLTHVIEEHIKGTYKNKVFLVKK